MLTFRDAAAEDAGLISRINAASWRTCYRGLISDDYLSRLPDEYWTPSVRAWLGSGQMSGTIALRDGVPVGAVLFGRGRDERYGSYGEVVSLYVLPDHTRSGVGSLLLTEALRSLKEDGYDRFYLWAIDGNAPADKFYRKHGFRRTEDRVPYRIGGQDVTDICYVRP
ncbi:MAG: GNAT family N-acetyltransferase [Clostridia bacterium]|nr:GNAT family N-acetyltransferase [Clostridia bacterium]